MQGNTDYQQDLSIHKYQKIEAAWQNKDDVRLTKIWLTE